jgi:hypothetical protein
LPEVFSSNILCTHVVTWNFRVNTGSCLFSRYVIFRTFGFLRQSRSGLLICQGRRCSLLLRGKFLHPFIDHQVLHHLELLALLKCGLTSGRKRARCGYGLKPLRGSLDELPQST